MTTATASNVVSLADEREQRFAQSKEPDFKDGGGGGKGGRKNPDYGLTFRYEDAYLREYRCYIPEAHSYRKRRWFGIIPTGFIDVFDENERVVASFRGKLLAVVLGKIGFKS